MTKYRWLIPGFIPLKHVKNGLRKRYKLPPRSTSEHFSKPSPCYKPLGSPAGDNSAPTRFRLGSRPPRTRSPHSPQLAGGSSGALSAVRVREIPAAFLRRTTQRFCVPGSSSRLPRPRDCGRTERKTSMSVRIETSAPASPRSPRARLPLGRNCESRSGNIATRPHTGPAESRLRVQAGQPRGPQGSGTDGLERGPDVRPLHAVQARVFQLWDFLRPTPAGAQVPCRRIAGQDPFLLAG
jgi:hypothetical protein